MSVGQAGPTALAGHNSLERLVTNSIIAFIELVFERAIYIRAHNCWFLIIFDILGPIVDKGFDNLLQNIKSYCGQLW